MTINRAFPAGAPRARSRGGGGYGQWLSAYRFAVINASIFLLFALLNNTFGLPMSFHTAAAGVFGIGSYYAFYRMCRNGGSLAAVSFFVFGAGTTFGFGTVGSIYAEGHVFRLLFSEADKIQTLPTINLINALSVWIVLLCSWPVAMLKTKSGPGQLEPTNLTTVVEMLQVFRVPAILLSATYFALYIYTFPIPQDLLVRNLLSRLFIIPLLVILLSFAGWKRLSNSGKAIAIVFELVMIVFGVLIASKTPVLLAILAMLGGLYIAGYRRAAAVIFAATLVFYFALLSSGVSRMRGDPAYNLNTNTISERAAIAVRAVRASGQVDETVIRNTEPAYYRFLQGPYQAYLIKEWWAGRPGDSLDDAWAALIPRVLWPDKPIITRFAGELYGQIFFQDPSRGGSAQAVTYTAEAFWNYGWVGVIVVSIVLGLEIGWFTRKWLKCVYEGSSQIGIVVFAVPIVLSSAWVETWIAPSYVGGFVTLVVLVKSVDMAGPLLKSIASARQARRKRRRLAISA